MPRAALKGSPWYRVDAASGQVPRPRTKLTVACCAGRMFVFGGGFHREFCDDLWEFHFDSHRFRPVLAAGDHGSRPPYARRSHSCVAHRHKLLFFGGRIKSGRLNDLHEFDVRTKCWRVIHPQSAVLQAAVWEGNGGVDLVGACQEWPYLEANLPAPGVAGAGRAAACSSEVATLDRLVRSIPCERAAHSACMYADRYMVIFGGNSSLYDFFLDDMHTWDCEKYIWQKVEWRSLVQPRGRLGHSTVVKGQDLYLFGGYGGESFNDLWVFSFATLQWREILYDFPISPSSFHAAVSYQDHMLVCGGSFGNQIDDLNPSDVFAFDLRTERWAVLEHTHRPERSLPSETPQCPSRRLGHVMVVDGHNLYLFAGSDQAYYNDLYVIHLEPPSLKYLTATYLLAQDLVSDAGEPEEDEDSCV
eukprot:GGOE01014723.1.p1 GENE.GGOE01014723.1~~GGOE01014723.1.p1  ORF type:complete len:428 (+),score=89.31 GGOE01014723.1:35-1285(+)